MNEDGLANKYLDLIKEDTSRAPVQLARMYGEIYSIKTDGKHFGIFNKLVKMYGWKIVFYALVDMYDIDIRDAEKFYPLLVYFAKKRLENGKPVSNNNLTDFVEKQKKELGVVRNIEIKEL